ncbi:MAG: hypothetical protein H6767_00225 [Candidatus Peribacteria bacterium]|nr:MAG: hypothetical protein H6767_00225 [Candidatus Peribacteria bacterium]
MVVVLTDGGDEVGTAHVEAHPDISVLVVGVGTEKGGYIPEGVNIF